MVKAGDVILIENGHKIYAKVPKHFVEQDEEGNFSLTTTDVRVGGNFAYLAGKYIVTHTALDGGGSSHDGGYPDGHHVFCTSVDKAQHKISFYQSGCFTAMIEDVQVVGSAELKWTIA